MNGKRYIFITRLILNDHPDPVVQVFVLEDSNSWLNKQTNHHLFSLLSAIRK